MRTVAYVDVDGSKLKKQLVWAMIKVDNVNGGFVHKLGEVDPKDVEIGMRVEAVFKEKKKRVGSMLDIEYFKPIKQPYFIAPLFYIYLILPFLETNPICYKSFIHSSYIYGRCIFEAIKELVEFWKKHQSYIN